MYDEIFSDLNWCGCGENDKALAYLEEVLTTYDSLRGDHDACWQARQDKGFDPLDDMAFYFVANALENAGYIEHGGNIVGSWLTARGEQALDWLRDNHDRFEEIERGVGESADPPGREPGS